MYVDTVCQHVNNNVKFSGLYHYKCAPNCPKTAEKQIESNVDTEVPCVGKVSRMTCQLKKAPTPPKVLGRNTSALETY